MTLPWPSLQRRFWPYVLAGGDGRRRSALCRTNRRQRQPARVSARRLHEQAFGRLAEPEGHAQALAEPDRRAGRLRRLSPDALRHGYRRALMAPAQVRLKMLGLTSGQCAIGGA